MVIRTGRGIVHGDPAMDPRKVNRVPFKLTTKLESSVTSSNLEPYRPPYIFMNCNVTRAFGMVLQS